MSPLTVARVGIGLAATLKALELWPVLIRLAGDPRVVQMPLAPWPRPSAAAAPWVAATWAGLGLTLAAGKAVPVTGTLLAALVGYVLTLDQQTYSNHLYLLALASLLLALAHTERHREPAVALLRWQLIIVYAFAAASKLNATFLSGSVIGMNLRPALREFASDRTLAALAVIAVAAEAFVAWGLMRPKWLVAGASVGIALHIGFVVLIRQTFAMFLFAMICLSIYPLFWLDERQ